MEQVEFLSGLLLAPLCIFLIFVAPIWLFLHYRSKNQVSQGLSEDEFNQLAALAGKAEKMSERIHNLERILDAEVPEWRHKQ